MFSTRLDVFFANNFGSNKGTQLKLMFFANNFRSNKGTTQSKVGDFS